MTATVIEPVVETTSGEEDGVTHISCHCTDNKIAWCGIDVSDQPLEDEGFEIDDIDSCVLCALVLDDLKDERCPWGCTCDDGCGPSPEDSECFGPSPSEMRGYSTVHSVLDEWTGPKHRK